MRLRCEVVSIQHNARTRHGDTGDVPDERVTVVLAPTHPGGNPEHPNWKVWGTRTVFGEVRLADLPVAQAAEFELNRHYTVEITRED